MRVLFLTSTLPRFAGDMQANFVGEQAAAWKAARPDDEITILAPHDQRAALQEAVGGIDVVRFRYFRPLCWQRLAYPAMLPNIKGRPLLAAQLPGFLAAEYLAARKIIRQRQIDLVYGHWVMPQGLVAWLLNKRLGTPYVLQNHSSDLSVFGGLGAAGRRMARAIVDGARLLFVVNANQQSYALSLFPPRKRATAGRKVQLLPMGVVDPTPMTPADGFEFGTISRLSRKKGIDSFILAANELAKSGERFRIGIAGDGEEAGRLQSLAGDGDVTFLGFMTGERKDRFLNDTAVFVVPSVTDRGDVEGMPVALLEALCRGKIVIASRDSNITLLPEWEQLKEFVFLLDDPRDTRQFADTMRAAASKAQKVGPQGSERVRAIMSRYLWPNLIREYQSLIESAR